MHPRLTTALCLLFCAVLLTSCGHKPVVRELEQLQCQVDRTALQPTPTPVFTAPEATGRTVALLIEDFKEALALCNASKASVLKGLSP